MRLIKFFALAVGGVYMLAVLGLVFSETRLVFYPNDVVDNPADYAITQPDVIWWDLPTKGTKVQSWHWHPTDKTKPTIVAYHGQSHTLGWRAEKWHNAYVQQGYGLLMVGYAHNAGGGGKPAEPQVLSDSLYVLNAFMERFSIAPQNIVVYGQSLGTGVAVHVAQHSPKVRALVLEAPYNSTAQVGQDKYPFFPVKWVMRNQFRSYERIPHVKSPVLIVHGDNDGVIPHHYGQDLYGYVSAPHSQFTTVSGAGHNDLYAHGMGQIVRDYLAKLPK